MSICVTADDEAKGFSETLRISIHNVVGIEFRAGSNKPQDFQDEPFDLQDVVILMMLQSNFEDTAFLDSQHSNTRETDVQLLNSRGAACYGCGALLGFRVY